MELFYYAIITFCLKTCNTMDEHTSYITSETYTMENCIIQTSDMIIQTREEYPRTKTRPINALCVEQEQFKKTGDSDKYIIWETKDLIES